MAELESEITVFRKIQSEIQRVSNQREQALTQVGENKMVIAELEFLEDDAKIFKLIGPVLVPQDLIEVKANVKTRIDFIEKDAERLVKAISTLEKQGEEQRAKVIKLQQAAQGGKAEQ